MGGREGGGGGMREEGSGGEGILIRFGPYHRDNRAGAGARCLRATEGDGADRPV